MVESVEKQKRILDYLERWAKNCRIKWLLRENDLNHLALHIIDEFYNVQLCCGCRVRSPFIEIILEMKEYDGTSTGTYCEECAERLLHYKGVKKIATYYDGKKVK